ncbi:24473_t:CDS:1, partial [Gigaspora margarita]
MKSIYTILLTFVIVLFLFGVSESTVFPRNGSFPAAKTFQGLEGSLKERALS